MAKNKNSKAASKGKKPAPAKAKAIKKPAAKTASKSASKPLKAKGKAPSKPAKVVAKAPPKKLEKVKAKAPVKPVPVAKVAKAAPPVKVQPPAAKGKTSKEKAQQIVREALTEAAMAGLPEKEVILTNADGLRYCKVADCDELATSDSYCRFHYLLNWKKIQLRKRILAGDKLDRYIEELTARYPDKYLEMIRKDLANEKDFLTAIQELEIDDSGDDVEFEDDARTYIDEVRGVSSGEDSEEF